MVVGRGLRGWEPTRPRNETGPRARPTRGPCAAQLATARSDPSLEGLVGFGQGGPWRWNADPGPVPRARDRDPGPPRPLMARRARRDGRCQPPRVPTSVPPGQSVKPGADGDDECSSPRAWVPQTAGNANAYERCARSVSRAVIARHELGHGRWKPLPGTAASNEGITRSELRSSSLSNRAATGAAVAPDTSDPLASPSRRVSVGPSWRRRSSVSA